MQEEQLSKEQLLIEIARLRQTVEVLQQEKTDLEILLEMTTEHSDSVEADLYAQTLEATQKSEKRLRQFLEALPVGIAVLDSKGEMTYTNERAQELLGKGFVPNASAEILPEVYQAYLAGTNELYPVEKQPILRALKGEISTVDDMEIHRDDRVVPLEVWGTPIFDEQGNLSHAIAAFQDITERKHAEAERQNLIEKLTQAKESLEKSLDIEFQLTDAYGRFVPHEFLFFLGYESIIDVNLGDHVSQQMSVMFADIRDFTTISERMNPEDNFKFINAYLSRMEPCIIENKGFVDKYIGDAIMALFNNANEAVNGGIAMLKALKDYNNSRKELGFEPIKIGIGINTGTLMLGTVGGNNHMTSTVISDAVNLASRLEGLTKEYGVPLLISHHTFEDLVNPQNYHIRMIDQVQVKGKSELVTVYEVFDADETEILDKKLQTFPKYEEAMLLYQQKKIQQAALLFQECLLLNPSDEVAKIYLARCQKEGRRKKEEGRRKR
ncbi:MAG: adenylate/guanylate cyclase domain-containing protein [Microcoleaceae cyanobacterium]|jgi:PAS domain S-box-containing protein